MTDKLLQKISDWREQSLQLRALETEITKALPDGDSDYHSPQMFEGFNATKSENKITITHSEGWASSFIRPDVDTSISVYSAKDRKRITSKAGKNSSGGGRPRKYKTDAERLEAKRKAVRKYRAKKK